MKAAAAVLVVIGLAIWFLRSSQKADAPKDHSEPSVPQMSAAASPPAVTPAPSTSAAPVSSAPVSSAPVSSAVSSAIPAGSQATEEKKLQFEKLVAKARATIPTVKELRALSEEELHTTPKSMVQAGIVIGDLAQAMKDDPSLVPQGIAFYQSCLFNDEYPTPIRALCYARATSHLKERGEKLENESQVPANVRDLARTL